MQNVSIVVMFSRPTSTSQHSTSTRSWMAARISGLVWGAGCRTNGCWREGPAPACMQMHQCSGMAQSPAIEDPPCFSFSAALQALAPAGFARSSTQPIRDIGAGGIGIGPCLDVPSISLDARLFPGANQETARPVHSLCFVCKCYCLLNRPHKMVLESASATRVRPWFDVMHCGTAAPRQPSERALHRGSESPSNLGVFDDYSWDHQGSCASAAGSAAGFKEMAAIISLPRLCVYYVSK